MDIRKLIKKDAWLAMRNNWGKAFAIVLISFSFLIFTALIEKLLSYILEVPYFIDSAHTPGLYLDDILNLAPISVAVLLIALLIRLFLYSPISLGNKQWYLGLAGSNPFPVSSVFKYFAGFPNFFRAFCFHLNLLIRKSLFWLLITAPAIIVLILMCLLKFFVTAQELFLMQLAFGVIFVCLFLLCQLLAICFLQRYFLAEYIFVLYQCKIKDAIKMSVLIMKGHKSEIFSVILSFLPYYIVNMLWLPAFITLPHMNTVYAIYAKYFIERFEQQKSDTASGASENSNDAPDDNTKPLSNIKAIRFPSA
ncbi:MAG: DUF975 family protein [Clostridiales bacterium]|nr:DUF975 family protein [Clostridiales bacterium]